MTQKIAIQGFKGSFHELAAQKYWGGDIEMLYCASFNEVAKSAIELPEITTALMAIENTIAGSILSNYDLIRKNRLWITGEISLEIRQHLLVYPGVTLEGIQEVHSHPMAILQCLDFLETHEWKLVETEDTALSAQRIHQQKSKHIAAIGSSSAANLFGLHNIAPDIHARKDNYTRFLVVSRIVVPVPDANKASLYLQVDHNKGRLAMILRIIADLGVNLSKVQSRAIAGNECLYGFYIDIEFDTLQVLEPVLEQLRSCTAEVIVYGIYKKATMERTTHPDAACVKMNAA